MNHEELQADLSLYALGALERDEAEAIEAHLASGCDPCRQELEQWRTVTALIALDADSSPAPNLKPALQARIRGVNDVAPKNRVARAPAERLIFPLAAAVSLMLLVGREVQWDGRMARLSAENDASRRELEQARQRIAAVDLQLQAKDLDLGALRASLARAEDDLAALAAPQLRLVRLKQTPDAPPRSAHVLVDLERRRALFFAFDLAPLPADKSYELWWISAEHGPINGGIFRPDQRGIGRVTATLPSDLGQLKAAAVTIEPAAGVPKPTGPMILLGSL